MDFLVVEAEGLPDIAGGRRVLGLAANTADKTVAKVVFHHQLHRYGGAPFLSPHLRTLAVVCLLRCRDEELYLDTLSAADCAEPVMLGEIRQCLTRSGEAVYWDGGRDMAAWLLGRALVGETAFSPLASLPLEAQLGLAIATADRCEIARRFGFECDQVPGDEANWDHYLEVGYAGMVSRCVRNALATARIFLRHRLVGGVITPEDHRLLGQRLDELALQHASPDAS